MRGIRIGSAFGIPLKLNWTFVIVLPVFAAFIAWDVAQLVSVINQSFGTTIDPAPLTVGLTPWILGSVSALALFFGVLLHELGHSLVAMRYGYQIDSITLWLLGGVASFTDFPENWGHEFWIAIAGPVVSVLVGVVSYAVFVALGPNIDAARFVLGYLAILNVLLAAFNLLPGFPMDGGRILRALLARTRPHAQATQQAAAVGKLFAFGLGIVGVFTNWFLIILAFFIYMAASSEAQQTTIKAAFEGIMVGDVMTHKMNLKTISEDTSISDLLNRMFDERHTGYPVVRNDDLVGMVTLEDAAAIDEIEQDAYCVEDVMSTDIQTVTADDDAMVVLQRMQQHDVGRLPVVDNTGNLVGIISRSDLMGAFSVIQQGGVPQRLRPPRSQLDFR